MTVGSHVDSGTRGHGGRIHTGDIRVRNSTRVSTTKDSDRYHTRKRFFLAFLDVLAGFLCVYKGCVPGQFGRQPKNQARAQPGTRITSGKCDNPWDASHSRLYRERLGADRHA